MPGTQQPYAYALNNPLRYTDPSGEFVGALLGGLAIGAVAGGVSYALQHRGQPLACFLQDPNFWRAVAIGGVSGSVSGFVAGFFAPLMLLSSGVGTAMQIGGLIGMLSSFYGHVVTNVLYGRPVAEGLGWAMLSGAVCGALGGALGYWAQQARPQPITQPGTGNGCTGGACSSSGWSANTAQATGASPASPNAIGRAGEEAAGIIGPKSQIPSLTGTANYRVPDGLIRSARLLREVKNVARLSYTRQLQDFVLYSQQQRYTFELVVRQTTRLSGPLQAAIQRGEIVLRYLPW